MRKNLCGEVGAKEVLHDLEKRFGIRYGVCLVEVLVNADPQRVETDDRERHAFEKIMLGDHLDFARFFVVVEDVVYYSGPAFLL